MSVCRLDFPVYRCDHVIAQRMVHELVLFFKFFFIFRLKIFSASLQNFVVNFIVMFYTWKSICGICIVKCISWFYPLILKFCFFLKKPLRHHCHLFFISRFALRFQSRPHFGKYLIIRNISLHQKIESFFQRFNFLFQFALFLPCFDFFFS